MSETGNGRKNWTRVVAAVGLVFLAVAGGIVLANANKVINKTEKKDEETPLISIGFSQVGAESEWRTGNSISIKTTFSQKRGYDLIFKDAQQQQEQQIKAIRGFIQQDVNYIVLAPVVETGWDTVLKEAKKAKIPVIIVDRQVKVKDDSLYTTWVGADFYQEGQKACSWMEQYAERNKKKTLNIVHIMGTEGATAQIGRTKALKEFIPVIEAEGIGRKGSIRPFNFTVNKGEVVGLTGLLGSGRSELVRAIYGADKPDSGKIKVNGKEVKINSPLDAMKLGMAYLPEDRKKDGIIADLSVRENIIIALQAKRGMFHPLSKKEMEEAADKYIEMLQIKTASRETPIKSLSGGNQQKVIIGRWLLTNPDYLILDEPTRGIDIGTKTEIQKLVLDLADQGMAVTFISSEVEEMLRTCSRMGVLRDGKKVGEISGNELSQEGIMKAIAGGGDNE